jgi:sec-independent protein translocase protein TatA
MDSRILFGLFNLGGGEIILILALILILFGAKKLPELAKGLGQGIKEFKKATKDVTDEMSQAMEEPSSLPLQKRLLVNTVQSTESSEDRIASQSSPAANA